MSAPIFDYIIVGAGSVLANCLSTDGKYSVLPLEAGAKDNYLWIHIPIGYAKTMINPKYNWCFYTEPDPGMNNHKVYWPRGKINRAIRLMHRPCGQIICRRRSIVKPW